MAKAFIREFERLQDAQSFPLQVVQEPGSVDQAPVDFSGGHAESAAFGANTRFVQFSVDAICSYVAGKTPVAATTNMRLPADTMMVIGVRPGDKLSFISNT